MRYLAAKFELGCGSWEEFPKMRKVLWVLLMTAVPTMILRADVASSFGACPVANLQFYLTTIDAAGGCTVDGLLLNKFAYQTAGSSPGGPVPANSVTISPIIDANGVGFVFQPIGGMTVLSPGHADGEISYVASTLDGTAGIGGIFASMDASFSGGAIDKVTEDYCAAGTTLPPDQLCPPNGVQQLFLSLSSSGSFVSKLHTFDPVSSIAVLKDIEIAFDNSGGPGSGTINSVTNQLQGPGGGGPGGGPEAVPEPGYALLLGGGVAALLLYRRRAQKSSLSAPGSF